MSFVNPADSVIRDILAQPRRIAVVGCSPDPSRDSNHVAQLLIDHGHHVIPVNPTAAEAVGRPCVATLREIGEPIDMVDVFRRSDQIDPIVDDAIAIGARILWLQLGVINEPAARRAQAAGLTVVMDRCPAIEYRRLFP